MRLSKHFTLDEFTRSDTAVRRGIDNTPSPTIAARLTATATHMERVRGLLGHPIKVNSGYRSHTLNAAVGGAATSAHTQGYAVDFVCPDFGTPTDIVRALADSNVPYDKVINEGSWVHISFDPRMRRIALVADFSSGKPTYTEGVA
jgi:hypothetical protein